MSRARPLPRFETFEAFADAPEASLDVALGAALIARDVYPELDVDALLEQFDALAEPLAASGVEDFDPAAQAAKMSEYLYGELGFHGNERDYQDPRNSLLPDVLERRTGIPISLAVVYVEVARRLGVEASGVGFPGHFLVRVDGASEVVFIDPFDGGTTLDGAALLGLLRRALGPAASLEASHLEPARPRAVVVRMLANLKGNYMGRGEEARAMLVLDRLLCLVPDAPEFLLERGRLGAKLGAVEAARADFSRLLALRPDAPGADAIRAQIGLLGKRRPLN